MGDMVRKQRLSNRTIVWVTSAGLFAYLILFVAGAWFWLGYHGPRF